jgi:hypothetical protein
MKHPHKKEVTINSQLKHTFWKILKRFDQMNKTLHYQSLGSIFALTKRIIIIIQKLINF